MSERGRASSRALHAFVVVVLAILLVPMLANPEPHLVAWSVDVLVTALYIHIAVNGSRRAGIGLAIFIAVETTALIPILPGVLTRWQYGMYIGGGYVAAALLLLSGLLRPSADPRS